MNNRIRLLETLKYIIEEATEKNPVGYSDIRDFLYSKGISPSKNTIPEDIKVIRKAGIDVITVQMGKCKKYFIPSEYFDTTEARLLIDSVIAAKFITPNKTAVLLEKLIRLTDRDTLIQYMNDVVVENRQKHRNCCSYYSIDIIQQALSKGYRLNFRYFELDENKERVYKHNNKVYEVCPITLINGMNNYYLIAYEPCSDGGGEKTFRIDRMSDAEISKRKIGNIPVDRDECIQRYRSSVFSMYSGHRIMAEFELDFTAMNIIYDKYGESIEVTPIGEKRYYAKMPIEDSPTFW